VTESVYGQVAEGSRREPPALELGELLATWRTNAELSQRQLAEVLLFASAAAIGNYEQNIRRPRLEELKAIDFALGAQGALVDLATALGTPRAFEARRSWAHNFAGTSHHVWAWLRPGPGTDEVNANLSWGPWKATLKRRTDSRGIFVTSPVSGPNPAAWVKFVQPGWADFGAGLLPPQLWTRAVDGIALADLADRPSSFLRLIARRVQPVLTSDQHLARQLAQETGTRWSIVERIFSQTGKGEVLDLRHVEDARVDFESPQMASGSAFLRAREGRAYSRAEAASLAGELIQDQVSEASIRNLEAGRHPRMRSLPAALDQVYGADGHLCRQRLDCPVGTTTFVFPAFWVGPVWIRLDSIDSEPTTVTLKWAPWAKSIRNVMPGTVVTCRTSPSSRQTPLRVEVSRRWNATVGIGDVDRAIDVNDNWHLDHMGHEYFLSQTRMMFSRALKNSSDVIDRVFGYNHH
jgi:hypothetical protein